jgi:hypothetical protein
VGKVQSRLIGALALATWAGCAAHAVQPAYIPPPRPASFPPSARAINVKSANGMPFSTIPDAFVGEAGLNDWTNQGLKSLSLLHLGPQCGDPVVVTDSSGGTAHGRLMVFHYRQALGPAGRGDYRIEVPDERVASAAAGRLTIHTELYKDAAGELYTAWAVVMSDQPLSCLGERMTGSYATPSASTSDAAGPATEHDRLAAKQWSEMVAAGRIPPTVEPPPHVRRGMAANAAPPPPAPAAPSAPAAASSPATEGECRMAAAHATTLARNEMRALMLYGEPLSPTDRQAMFDAQVPKDLGIQAKRVLDAPPAKREALLGEINAKFATDLQGVYVARCAQLKSPLIRCVLRAVSLAQQEACAMDQANW